MKKISIIVPVYNSEKTIKRCIDSLLKQTYNDIEIIIIDDGSTDKSNNIIRTYKLKSKNIRVIEQSNQGVSIARNRGLSEATGDYIMFVDSDDCLDREACYKLIDEMDEDIDLIIFGLNIYQNGILLRTPHLENGICKLDELQDNYWKLRKINLGPCNKIYKFNKINQYFDATLSLGEDTKFVIDYLKNVDSIKILEDCLYNVYLDNEDSLNRKYREDRLEQLNTVRKYEEDFLYKKYGYVSYKLYNEYFLDLHVILFDVVRRGWGANKIRKIIQNINYENIYEKGRFEKIYYKIFAIFVRQRRTYLLYLLLKTRIIVLKILDAIKNKKVRS